MSSHTNCGEVLKQGDRLGPVPECPDRARHAFALRLKADRENPAWTKETFARARKARDVLPEIFGAASAAKMSKPRGRPKSGRARTSISIRLPPETLARWKATGPGWQTRMAEALSRAV
jgi:uncharacterized protein (DUF4415 family)